MSLIKVSKLTFSYDGSYDNIFENVSFSIDTDWKTAFTGRNGRGKTTFLNLLLEKYKYSGSISKNVDFEYFPYRISDDKKTAIEIVEEIYPDYEYWRLSREISILKMSDEILYRPFCLLSKGEQTKLLLSIMFLKENSFLLIDEPTNHLDIEARQLVSDYLKTKKGFILVSHDRSFVDNCVDHILSINKTNIEIQQGNFSSWLTNKEMQDNFEISENEKLKKEIKRLSQAAKRASDWSDKTESGKYNTLNSGIRVDRGFVGHKAAKMMKSSKVIEARQNNAIEEKSGLLKNIEDKEKLKIFQLEFHLKKLVEIENLSISYGENKIFDNLSFNIEQGDRIALYGKNGSGKSSILKLICGENIDYTGNIIMNNQLKISYVSQDTSFLKGNLSEFALINGLDESIFKALLRKLDFSRVQFEKDMSGFSGGQKKKVLIAKSLSQKVHLHIWDEPLNFVDIISRMQIEELILEYKPTLLFVEHDKAFCEKIATNKINLQYKM